MIDSREFREGPLGPLFEPIQIGAVNFANRFVMPAMQRMCCIDGAPSQEFADYYSSRAKGGAALIISEGSAIDHPSATKFPFVLRLEPSKMDGWKLCADSVHQAGGRFFVQLFHEGAIREEGKGPYPNAPTLSPSGLYMAGKPCGRAATWAELQEIKDAYVRAAIAAEGFGADGVEIHSAHGYLLHQFLWRETNLRNDEYGGHSIYTRIRFAQEIVQAIRAAVKQSFLISFRISQFAEVNFNAQVLESPEDLAAVLRILEEAGVNMFNMSTRRFWKPEWADSSLTLAGWTKRFTSLPVVTVGSVGLTADLFEIMFAGADDAKQEYGNLRDLVRRFQAGLFDMVAIGRGMYADPLWVKKVGSGRFSELVPWRKGLLDHLNLEPSVVEAAHVSDERR